MVFKCFFKMVFSGRWSWGYVLVLLFCKSGVVFCISGHVFQHTTFFNVLCFSCVDLQISRIYWNFLSRHAFFPSTPNFSCTDPIFKFCTPQFVSETLITFLTHISVAVAHAVARCTNCCTCRKGSVIARPTNRKLAPDEDVNNPHTRLE